MVGILQITTWLVESLISIDQHTTDCAVYGLYRLRGEWIADYEVGGISHAPTPT